MKFYIFSDETVRQAEAALTLGFDVVARVSSEHGSYIELANANQRVRIVGRTDSSLFRELDPGDDVSLLYIKHWKACNTDYGRIKKKFMCEGNRNVIEKPKRYKIKSVEYNKLNHSYDCRLQVLDQETDNR